MTSALSLQPRPAVAPPALWRFPAPRCHRLDNGVSLYVHHLPGQHVASIVCHLGIPAYAEPDGRHGIAAVMAASLGTGTQAISARRFEQLTAASGISWDASPGWTGPAITLEVPAAQLPAALDLLGEALAEPAFYPAEVTSQIQVAAAGLAHAAADPHTRALQELPGAVYGGAGRAGRPAGGTLATLTPLTPDEIAAFHDAQVRPAATTIVIAGDLSGLDAAALAAEALGTWQDRRPARSSAPPPEPAPRRPAASVLVDQPGAVQTHLLLAAPVPGRGQPCWNELTIAAHILGAPITGHLDARLRETSGQTYGLRAGLTELVPGTGLLLVSGAITGDATISALGDIISILAAPLREGFSDSEHATAAEAITRMTPLACETPAQVAALTAGLAAAGLPPDFPDLVLDDIAALTTREVNGAYTAQISPDQLTLIAVGDAAVLAGPLQELSDPVPLQVISS